MNNRTISLAFLTKYNIVLSIEEIGFAIAYDKIYFQDLSQIVDLSLSKYPDNEDLLDLALDFLLDKSYIDTNLKNLGFNYDISVEEESLVTNKWRYIILLWLFENRCENDLDYDKINMVYADFNYPSDMHKFVSYMPPQEVNNELGYQCISNNWKKYLDENRYLLNL